MKKISTAAAHKIGKVEGRRLTVGLDLGDRSSWYCVLDEAGEVLLERKLATTPKAMKEVFGGMPRSRITLHVRNSTVGALLDAITHSRGYSWFVYGDVVIVTHKGAPQGRKNLLDTRIREFAIAREVTLQAASLHVHDRAERRDGSGGRFRVLGRKDDRGHRGEDPGPAHGGPGELSDRGPRRLEDPDRGVEENSRPVTRRNCESCSRARRLSVPPCIFVLLGKYAPAISPV